MACSALDLETGLAALREFERNGGRQQTAYSILTDLRAEVSGGEDVEPFRSRASGHGGRAVRPTYEDLA